MCGIVGYIGPKSAVQIAFDGLRKLEYRGYDSAGIATLDKATGLSIQKESGKLSRLEPLLSQLPTNSHVSIGHTRWATHGSPSKENAHPHQSQQLAIVHNGIIENYDILKSALIQEGYQFKSDTDTEVIVHLIQKEFHSSQDLDEALMSAAKQLKGAYALALISSENPDTILLAKQGSPLVIGMGQNEQYFGSDITVFAEQVKRAVFLNDGEWAKLSCDGIEIKDFDGKAKPTKATILNWTPGAADKSGYRHYMLKEIHEQTGVITRSIDKFLTHSQQFNLESLGLNALEIEKIKSIHIIGCGTALIAGRLAKYFLEPLCQIPVSVEQASEYRYRDPLIQGSGQTLIIAISQSGETADTLACLRHAKQAGAQIFSVCNVPYSSIDRESDSTLHMGAGPEIGVASTKAFTSQVLCMYLWSLAFAEKIGRLTLEKKDCVINELQQLPVLVDLAINNEDKIKELVYSYYEYPNFLYIGRGPSYAIALEGALKLKEISYIHAEAYAAGELKHGPIALIDHNMPVVAIVPQDQYYEKTLSNIEEICAREGKVIAIGCGNDNRIASICEAVLPCPQVKDTALQAILSTVPIQLLAYHIATRRGTDVDQPRNLAKSVTVE